MRVTLHLVLAELIVLIGLSLYVAQQGVLGSEVDLTRWVHGWPDVAGLILIPVMQVGTRWFAAAVALAVGLRLGLASGLRVLASVGIAWGAAELLKVMVERPRIGAAELLGPARSVADGWSYPSTHTAIAFVLAVVLALELRASRRILVVLFAVASLVGVARMFVGVHLPMDILGGALVGIAAAHLLAAVSESPLRSWRARLAGLSSVARPEPE